MSDNILSAKENKWLCTVMEFMSPKVRNKEYRYRISRHQEGTICSGGRKCQKQPSDSPRIRILHGLVGISPPGIENSGIFVQGPI